uniref:Zinc finger and BTB domain containing 41 n=1 Tax=Cyprinus carpio TaxID=7962 RepID=A0A8C1UM84_CYPCA
MYRAHRVVLAFGSGYFHAKFSGNPELQHATIDIIEVSTFGHLLNFLYTSELDVSESQIPALAEAACFLDIMEAVNLSAKRATPAHVDVLPVPVKTPDVQTSAGAQCTFCYKKSLENHLTKTHSAGCQVEDEQNAVTTCRSARQRRTPAKFENRESENGPSCLENLAECADGEKQEEEHVAAEQTEAQEENEPTCSRAVEVTGHVFPEGLAPVIIQSTNKKTLKCPRCEKTFDRIGKYESHTRVHTGEKPLQCDICLQCYSTKSNLTVHKKKHDPDSPVQRKEHKCLFCNKLHASKKTLSRHEFLSQKKKKSEGWKCDICHKSFSHRPHLEEHMILHSQDKPFKCFNDTGNRKHHIEFRERTTLREHLRIHSGEKPHLCSICGQSFRHGSSYRLHLRVHHEDKRYECDECGKTFIRHDHLKKNKKNHTGERVHQCEECGKCFRRADHLTVCKKEFRGKTNLMSHFRTHSGEKPHRCVICNQTFRIMKTLTKHMVIHSDVRPLSCPHCSTTFKRKDKRKYHVDHVHSGRPLKQQQPNLPSVMLVPIQMTEESVLAVHGTPHRVLPAVSQQQQTGYQSTTDLVFLEKYTLTPQPTINAHPVRPEQMLDPREQSYLGTLLGLDSAPAEQNMSSAEHTH